MQRLDEYAFLGARRGAARRSSSNAEAALPPKRYVSFRTDEAWQLEEWVANKQDWDGVKLALSHAIDSKHGNYKETLPPWAGRGNVPDGSKAYLPDYMPYIVNMGAVTVRRVEHGFGVFKQVQHGVRNVKTQPFLLEARRGGSSGLPLDARRGVAVKTGRIDAH